MKTLLDQHIPAKLGYTIDEFVKISGVGRTKVYFYIKTGQLKARKAGRHTIILGSDGEAFMRSLPVMEAA